MCGICGVAGIEDRMLVEKMCRTIQHRGPDSGGVFQDRDVVLGIRRLRVIDLVTGDQPIANEEGNVHVVFNGEIYNFRELRRGLEAKGHEFRTRTDTEVIVHLYEEEGEDFVQHLRGMFGVAVWDGERKRLILARDRLGIKPLYYAVQDGALLFASELKALLVHESLPRDLSPEGLSGYLEFRYVPGPWTLLASVRKLLPGHFLVWSRGSMEIRKYWRLSWSIQSRTLAEAAAELRRRLEESVDLHMVSDVPLGVFLSGGLDSSAVTALASQRSAEPVQTFSVGFDVPSLDETPYARQVSEHLGTDHHEMRLDATALRRFPEIAWHLDEPLADAAAIPTYLLAEWAKKRVTVALTGEGADEIFAGYNYYARIHQIPPALNRWLTARVYLLHIRVFSPAAKKELVGKALPPSDVLKFCRIPAAPLHRAMNADTHVWLPDDLLMKVDKTTMAHGLEARVPYLDHPLVEYMASLPPEFKVQGGVGKVVLRKAVRDLLPETVLERKKQGFVVPTPFWIQEEFKEVVQATIASARSGVFQKRALEYYAKRVDHPRLRHQVWTLFSFELWHRLFLESGGTPPRRLSDLL